MSNIVIQAAVANNMGIKRKNNEDNFFLNGFYMQRDKVDEGAFLANEFRDDVQLYAVCDGMGGADCGEDASFCAVYELAQCYSKPARLVDEQVLTAEIARISGKIFTEAEGRGQKSGTTLALLLTEGEKLHIANVGDSRVYRYRGGKLEQLSVDHTKVARMVAMGLMTAEQAKTDRQRHVISQYLGMPTDIRIVPHVDSSQTAMRGDIYLLCSDGLSDMVEDERIAAIISKSADASDAVSNLITAALNAGGKDNVTVMILRVLDAKHGSAQFDQKQKENAEPEKKWPAVMNGVLTALQILTGLGAVATVIDLVYYLLH